MESLVFCGIVAVVIGAFLWLITLTSARARPMQLCLPGPEAGHDYIEVLLYEREKILRSLPYVSDIHASLTRTLLDRIERAIVLVAGSEGRSCPPDISPRADSDEDETVWQLLQEALGIPDPTFVPAIDGSAGDTERLDREYDLTLAQRNVVTVLASRTTDEAQRRRLEERLAVLDLVAKSFSPGNRVAQ